MNTSKAAAHLASLRKRHAGQPKVLRPCPKCGRMFGARELRVHKPKCGRRGK